MRYKLWAVVLVAGLVAAAFFLPEHLLLWGDRQLVDNLHVESQSEDREGFAESLQLTVPEKVMLLRSDHMTVMELDQFTADSILFNIENGGMFSIYSVETEEHSQEWKDRYEEAASLWNDRLTAVCGELRSLQTLGGLPVVWGTEDPVACTDCGDLLYLDSETRLSFQAYQIMLLWNEYNIDLLIDVQSGRILSFAMVCSQEKQLTWDSRGAANFGSAWRDYWQMDSVSTGWYNEYTRSILENVTSYPFNNSDYAAVDQITFMYDGLSLPVPLDCQGAWSRYFSISWNR